MTPVNLTISADSAMEKAGSPAKTKDAAQQFEALLIGQLLKSVRESGSGWLGDSPDAGSSTAMEYAEQHLATVLAHQGGLGMAALIAKGLKS
jgi:peptidoglycan hydrolase FlgJ